MPATPYWLKAADWRLKFRGGSDAGAFHYQSLNCVNCCTNKGSQDNTFSFRGIMVNSLFAALYIAF